MSALREAGDILMASETPHAVFEALLSEFIYAADIPAPHRSRTGWRKRWAAAVTNAPLDGGITKTPRTWTLRYELLGDKEAKPSLSALAYGPHVAKGDVVEVIEKAPVDVERERMLDALERLHKNAERIFAQTPVRDWGETLAESSALLQRHGRLS